MGRAHRGSLLERVSSLRCQSGASFAPGRGPAMDEAQALLPAERIEHAILVVRGERVMLDEDIAALYGVETKTLVRAMKRNLDRFPLDFMFQLTDQEVEILRCQIGTSRWGGRRYLPYAFTEQGVAMLSSILRSEQSVRVN